MSKFQYSIGHRTYAIRCHLICTKKIIIRLSALVILIVIVLLNHSCSPAYVPNMVNSPLLSNKGEFNASAAIGTSGIDPQFSYALSHHVGLMFNSSFANTDTGSEGDYHKHSIIELGAGYYNTLSKSGRFEIYGGFGSGKVDGQFTFMGTKSINNAKYKKIFIQPAIGASTKIFDGSLATRFSFINMDLSDPLYTGKNKYSLFIEPVITCKFGYKHVKFVWQFGVSIATEKDIKRQYEYQPIMMSFGLQLNLGRRALWDD